jgi:hypothetical protein
MEGSQENTHFVKRVVLPSGKTIEVVYFQDGERAAPGTAHAPAPADAPHRPVEPDQELHLCLDCGSGLVYPVEWEEAGLENWTVLLQCPDCDTAREGVFSQATVEAFDEELDRGTDALARDYKRLLRANMCEEIDRFVGALQAGAILPEDF